MYVYGFVAVIYETGMEMLWRTIEFEIYCQIGGYRSKFIISLKGLSKEIFFQWQSRSLNSWTYFLVNIFNHIREIVVFPPGFLTAVLKALFNAFLIIQFRTAEKFSQPFSSVSLIACEAMFQCFHVRYLQQKGIRESISSAIGSPIGFLVKTLRINKKLP